VLLFRSEKSELDELEIGLLQLTEYKTDFYADQGLANASRKILTSNRGLYMENGINSYTG
jgi:hypothetical protein